MFSRRCLSLAALVLASLVISRPAFAEDTRPVATLAHIKLHGDLDEAPVARHMSGREIRLAVDIGIGDGRATIWTCDLTHGYIDINGSYRS